MKTWGLGDYLFTLCVLVAFTWGLLTWVDPALWHSKHWPWSSYEQKGPWHNCYVSEEKNSFKVTCAEGELGFVSKSLHEALLPTCTQINNLAPGGSYICTPVVSSGLRHGIGEGK